MSGVPVIIHLDEEEHWVVAMGCLGDSLIAFDSHRNALNQEENGVRVLTPQDLGKKLFGICVKRPLNHGP